MEQQIQNNDYECTRCHYPLVSKAVQEYSKKWFGKVLCRTCQNIAKGEKAIEENCVHRPMRDESEKACLDCRNHETINLENGQVACITCQIKSEEK